MPSPATKAEEMKRRYLREAVITASPATRLNMLFDKMVLELELVDGAFERDDYKDINDRLCRVQDILLALRGTLRTDRLGRRPTTSPSSISPSTRNCSRPT